MSEHLQSTNPATGTVIASFAHTDPGGIEAALESAARGFSNWRTSSLESRAQLLSSLATQLLASREHHAALITSEMGKPLGEAIAEIEKCALTCRYYAENLEQILSPEVIASSAAHSAVLFEPLGPVLAIMPWNYPYWQFFRFAAPAIAAGNSIILKHANNVTGCAIAIEKLMADAGAPSGILQVLKVRSDAVADIIADRRVAAVTFTGSTRVGRIIAAVAGRAVKKQVLELGGSDPFIVLDDADAKAAAVAAAKSRFINAGQSCVNAKRFIVHQAIADEFVETFVDLARALTVGDPMDPETRIGPLARADIRNSIHDQAERTVAAGGKLLLGGHMLSREGYFYPPTVIDDARPGMAAVEEETFGPLAPIIRVTSTEAAVHLANDTEYGLAATIFSQNVERAKALSRQIDAGAVFINGVVASDPRLPFGGVKQSGYGRELGAYGVKEFVNSKTVWIGG